MTLDARDKYGSRYHCYVCKRKHARVTKATVRVFSGRHGYGGGEGYPACDEHAHIAISAAMKPLAKYAGWTVRAMYVDADEEGYPRMTRTMFKATSKLTEDLHTGSANGVSRR